MTEDHIAKYRVTRVLLPQTEVKVWLAPPEEESPHPEEGERVIFLSHLVRGFALPVHPLFLTFLAFFDLRLHHLGANAIGTLAHFAAFCECYLGIQQDLGLFCRLFHVWPQVQFTQGPLVACGGVSIYSLSQTGYPKFRLQDTVQLWQQSYFYVSNVIKVDRINLPAF